MVLKGSVKSFSEPHLNQNNMRLRAVTPEPSQNLDPIEVGQCFGTITELKDREITTR